MLKIKDNELGLYTKDELIKIIKEIEEENKQKDNIIMALEDRLEKLEVKPQIQAYAYAHPTLGEVICTRHTIPAFTYCEYQNFGEKELRGEITNVKD